MFVFDSMYDTMTDIVTVTGSVLGGLLVGYIFVGLFVYKPVRTNQIDDDVDDSDMEETIELDEKAKELLEFQDSGYDTLSEMKCYPIIKEKFDHLRTSFIDIETPEGLCKMNYDDSVESFTYYCDNRAISYKTLDAVARQYAIKYNCKNICVNYKDEYEKAKKRLQSKQQVKQQEQMQEQAKQQEQTLESNVVESKELRSPFAKLKNYKTVDQPSVLKAKTNKHNNETNNKNEEEQDVLVITKANKFRFNGLIKDFVQPNPNAKSDSYKNINYSSFKHLINDKSTTM
jgi:hypothetical protein